MPTATKYNGDGSVSGHNSLSSGKHINHYIGLIRGLSSWALAAYRFALALCGHQGEPEARISEIWQSLLP